MDQVFLNRLGRGACRRTVELGQAVAALACMTANNGSTLFRVNFPNRIIKLVMWAHTPHHAKR